MSINGLFSIQDCFNCDAFSFLKFYYIAVLMYINHSFLERTAFYLVVVCAFIIYRAGLFHCAKRTYLFYFVSLSIVRLKSLAPSITNTHARTHARTLARTHKHTHTHTHTHKHTHTHMHAHTHTHTRTHTHTQTNKQNKKISYLLNTYCLNVLLLQSYFRKMDMT